MIGMTLLFNLIHESRDLQKDKEDSCCQVDMIRDHDNSDVQSVIDQTVADMKKEEENRYQKFIQEFTEYRKQEIDIFKSNQVLFVKNMQKEVNRLTAVVKAILKHHRQSDPEGVDIDILQESIESVSNNLQKYFTHVTNKSIENESYFSNQSQNRVSLEERISKSKFNTAQL